MDKISEDILSEIKEHNLTPRPRWQFLAFNGLWWLSAGLALAFGSLAMALIIFGFTTNDWQWAKYTGGWWYLALSALPIIWLIVGAVLIGFGDYNLQQTKKAYRWRRGYILIIVLVSCALIGLAIERVGWAQELDEFLSPGVPEMLTAPAKMENFWHQPAKGLISGTVLTIDNNILTLKDYTGEVWQVDISQAVWPKNLPKVAGKRIKVYGAGDEQNFQAKDISPWQITPKQPKKIKKITKVSDVCSPERKDCPLRINNQKGPSNIKN